MNVSSYYLDLKGMSKLKKTYREQITAYYMDMLISFNDNRPQMGKSILLTLEKTGYLLNDRDEKLKEILGDED